VHNLNIDIFDSFTSKMEGRQLAYLKNQKHINLTSALNATLYHEDLFQYYSKNFPEDEELHKQELEEEIAHRKLRRA
jgi:hypothetical protein